MAMINYADKVALNQNSNIADINKVKADDMNELKKAFNDQVAQGWYRTGLNPTFTYVSYDSTTKTGIVSSNLDLTPYLSVGMKIKFTQNSAIKYAFITAITSTQLTLFLGTDYSLNNSAISNSYFSMLKAPFGFPLNPEKWTLLITSTAQLGQNNPVQNQFYSFLTINIPIGSWIVEYQLIGNSVGTNAANIFVGLSTSVSSFTEQRLISLQSLIIAGGVTINAEFSRNRPVNLSAETTYYLIARVTQINQTFVSIRGDLSTTTISAVCAYL